MTLTTGNRGDGILHLLVWLQATVEVENLAGTTEKLVYCPGALGHQGQEEVLFAKDSRPTRPLKKAGLSVAGSRRRFLGPRLGFWLEGSACLGPSAQETSRDDGLPKTPQEPEMAHAHSPSGPSRSGRFRSAGRRNRARDRCTPRTGRLVSLELLKKGREVCCDSKSHQNKGWRLEPNVW